MKRSKKEIIFITLLLISPISLHMLKVNAGSFGAEIFCTMRDGGNDHESSWDAAYSYIKKQKGGIFKVSPKQAASQIVETVVREKEEFSYCVEYLNKLHPDRKLIRDLKKEEEKKRYHHCPGPRPPRTLGQLGTSGSPGEYGDFPCA